MRFDGWKLAATVIGLIMTVLTLACSLAFSLGILNAKVDSNVAKLSKIEDMLLDGGFCRICGMSLRSK